MAHTPVISANSADLCDEQPAARAVPSRRAFREVAIALTAAAVYFGGRLLIEGGADEATRNAERILDIERSLGIDVERRAQDAVLGSDVLRSIGNLSYVWLHWPLLITVLIVLFHRSHLRYTQLRNSLMASGAVGLMLFWVFPAAPPRFMPGFEGTVSDDARRHYLDYPLSWTNQYASFPSFHIGWTLLACLALAATFESGRRQAVAMIPAVLVALAVVTTANHYVLDTIAGAGIAFVAYAWFGSRHELPTIGLRTPG
jgi:membrane-associated phospholipid phosphatase